MIDFNSFYISTKADWTRCEIPDRNPDYVSFTGSAYWDMGDRVRRLSDHWGRVSSCIWLLEGEEIAFYTCGECFYEDFYDKL